MSNNDSEPEIRKGCFTYQCWRCKKIVNDECFFKYGVQTIKYGYTMLTKPLCKECSDALDVFLDGKDGENVASWT